MRKVTFYLAFCTLGIFLSLTNGLSCHAGGSLSMDDSHSKEVCSSTTRYCVIIEVSNTDFPFYIMSCEDKLPNTTMPSCVSYENALEYADPPRNVYGTRYCCSYDFCNYPSYSEIKWKVIAAAVLIIAIVGCIIALELIFLTRNKSQRSICSQLENPESRCEFDKEGLIFEESSVIN